MGHQLQAIKAFHKLHQSGCFVIPNAWDAGSAILLEKIGFQAIATTSSGLAYTHGYPDDQPPMNRSVTLSNAIQIASATNLPVSVDFQDGYARDPEKVAESVLECLATGIAGLSIEDSTGEAEPSLYERGLAVERIRAARKAIDDSGIPAVLVARCEAALIGMTDSHRIILDRLPAYAEAGADCLFSPLTLAPIEIRETVTAVSPKPLNVIITRDGTGHTVQKLADLGVRRISVGSSLARVAIGGFLKSARDLMATGSFETFREGAPFSELQTIFRTHIRPR